MQYRNLVIPMALIVTTLPAAFPAEATPSAFDTGNPFRTTVCFAGWVGSADDALPGAGLGIGGLLSVPPPEFIANRDPLPPAVEDVQRWTDYGSLDSDW